MAQSKWTGGNALSLGLTNAISYYHLAVFDLEDFYKSNEP